MMSIAIGMIFGCTGDTEVSVRGVVEVDGVPVSTGSVTFYPADGKSSVGGGSIVDGRYTAKVIPGDKTVQINAMRPTEQRNTNGRDGESEKVFEALLPRKYQSPQTPLTATVEKNQQVIDFKITRE